MRCSVEIRCGVFRHVSRSTTNPFMWPLIYKANSQQIRDPELIFPRQIFVIPRNYTPEEAAAAIQRARQRGAWRLGDGR